MWIHCIGRSRFCCCIFFIVLPRGCAGYKKRSASAVSRRLAYVGPFRAACSVGGRSSRGRLRDDRGGHPRKWPGRAQPGRACAVGARTNDAATTSSSSPSSLKSSSSKAARATTWRRAVCCAPCSARASHFPIPAIGPIARGTQWLNCSMYGP